ncbi:MAG: DUF2948 family protein [Hyphomicrobiaceae bacterium]
MQDLKLIAMDAEDLAIISAQLQDAVLKVADIAYLPRENRFAALANRFNWSATLGETRNAKTLTRHRCALRIERITSARLQGIDLRKKDDVLSLLTVQFEQLTENDPAGQITLIFAGGGAIQFDVECIEIELRDLGGAWATASRPDHTDGDSASD